MSAPIFVATSPDMGKIAVCMLGQQCWHRYGDSIGELADAGRAHLHDKHPTKADLDATWAAGGNVYQAETYCRACGVRHGSTDENHAQRSHRCSGEMQNNPSTANGGTP